VHGIPRHQASQSPIAPACRIVLAVCLSILGWWHTLAGAATFTVNSTNDVNDLTPGNGLCVAYLIIFPPFVLPFCTLRGAIEEANALPGPDRIIVPAGLYPLALSGTDDTARNGDLDITDTLFLSGTGAKETIIDGGGLDRIFDLSKSASEVYISGMTIKNGSLPAGLSGDEAGGGGIRNQARLTLIDLNLQDNAALDDAGGGLLNRAACTLQATTVARNRAVMGGGIANRPGGTLLLQTSTVRDNGSEAGGGLFNEGRVTVVNSTFSGNRAQESALATGGGLLNYGFLDLLQSTVAANQASIPGGGISNKGILRLANTLVADNVNGDCDRTRAPLSLGHNLDSDASCRLSATGDLSGVDPRIDGLGPHGGPTDTHGLLLGSPAVDRGRDLRAEGVATDQRGITRPQGLAYDIGAFETGPRSLVPLIMPLLPGQGTAQ